MKLTVITTAVLACLASTVSAAACSSPSGNGYCQNRSTFPGYCPGGTSIQCCVGY
ncbi:hypothetical protein QBC37DRAFT_379793 [Rhypophila decipiens]|uniref:Uncharacterized protein n=1 Tax=Rhypophila decipiens TaxID=261697 RepID=A0AAN6XY40_9PEZI|nr:hypothetical protein QBC37DRAFT_379793 [Rhypophila decipiens]